VVFRTHFSISVYDLVGGVSEVDVIKTKLEVNVHNATCFLEIHAPLVFICQFINVIHSVPNFEELR
jgi:hypothetical protein